MKKLTLLLTVLTLAFTVNAQRSNVTFQVNLNGITDMYEGGGVWVLYDDWTDWDDMTDGDGDGIYTFVLDTTEAAVINYRFSYQTGPDDGADYTEETLPAECANAGGNREITVPVSDTVLPAYVYSYCDSTDNNDSVNVTFNVDMSLETVHANGVWLWAYNEADPDNDTYWVQMADGDADDIYSTTLKLPKEMLVWYNYYNGDGDNDVETVVDGCRYDIAWNDRFVSIVPIDMDIPSVPFGGCNDTTELAKVNITFSVDMTNTTVLNNEVWVVIKNPWKWTQLTEGADNVWSATVEMPANAEYPYTFVNGGQDNWDHEESVPEECNYGSVDAPERRVEVAESDTTLAIVGFGECSAPVEKYTVTFRVDMKDETVTGDGVQIVIKNPWIWTAMADNDGDDIWEATVDLAAGTYPYTFVNGAQDAWDFEEDVPAECNEGSAESPERHVEVVDADLMLDAVMFGTCEERSGTGNTNTTIEGLTIYPNPADDKLYLSSLDESIESTTLIDLSGRIVSEQKTVNKKSVTIDLQDVAEGVYILVVKGQNVQAITRLVVKH